MILNLKKGYWVLRSDQLVSVKISLCVRWRYSVLMAIKQGRFFSMSCSLWHGLSVTKIIFSVYKSSPLTREIHTYCWALGGDKNSKERRLSVKISHENIGTNIYTIYTPLIRSLTSYVYRSIYPQNLLSRLFHVFAYPAILHICIIMCFD